MSQFSGKCDFYDSFYMITNNGDEDKVKENLKKLKLYVRGNDGREHRVESDTIKDIAKYYPYLSSISYGDKEGNRVIYLASDSFIDQEEAEMRSLKVKDVMRYWNKCKRNKLVFNEEECLEKMWWSHSDELKEIIRRIAKDGKKAEFEDIHFPMWEYYRRQWFKEMVRVGWTGYEAYNWCFKGIFDPPEIKEKRLGRQAKKD